MRQYQPIWYLLRQNKQVKLRAHPVHHNHIVRMVSKEKYEDLYYQRGLKQAGKKAWINVAINADIIIFTLHSTLSLTDLGLVQMKDDSGKWVISIGAIPNVTLLQEETPNDLTSTT